MSLHRSSLPYKQFHFPHYYLCNYLPVSVGQDALSQSLLHFKRGRQPDLDAWIDCSLEALNAVDLPPHTIIIRALQHEETSVREDAPSSLDLLGQSLASHFHCHYCPFALYRSQPSRETKILTREQREVELAGLYRIDRQYTDRLHGHPLLILDDILTTGTTMKMIATALDQHGLLSSPPMAAHMHRPTLSTLAAGTPLSIFTLAKADYDANLNKITPLKGQNYHLDQGLGWMVAEEPAAYGYSLTQLKGFIQSDTFLPI
jgi:predicted amidophosphoribosyltransferase